MKKVLSVLLSLILFSSCLIATVPTFASEYIGSGKAKTIAYNNAGVKASMVISSKAKLDYENGIRIYDVEFRTSLAEYDYEINAETGRIIDKDIDKYFSFNLSASTYTYNGKSKKPTVTLRKNGSKISSSNYKVSYKNTKNPGKALVTVKFNDKNYTGQFSRHYTIKPKGQKITSVKRSDTTLTIKWSKDSKVSGYQIQYSTSSSFKNAKTKTITDNSITSKTITGVKQQKYYARIRAYKDYGTSRIYGAWSAKGATGSDYIGTARAKEIALNDAGFTSSQVSHLYAHLDTENGIKVYEVEFTKNGYEYEYTINATSGKIIDSERERA